MTEARTAINLTQEQAIQLLQMARLEPFVPKNEIGLAIVGLSEPPSSPVVYLSDSDAEKIRPLKDTRTLTERFAAIGLDYESIKHSTLYRHSGGTRLYKSPWREGGGCYSNAFMNTVYLVKKAVEQAAEMSFEEAQRRKPVAERQPTSNLSAGR
jgi:hypothetical protein